MSDADRPMSATEIARISKLHGSTVHRFLVNLEESGFLSRDDDSSYRLGPRCVSLGYAALKQFDVRKESLPFLEKLNGTTRETIHLTIRDRSTAVYIDKLDSPEPLRIFSRIGASVPLHCSAVGKVFLAFLDPEEQDALLKKLELKRFTSNTICSIRVMKKELTRIAVQGYALDNEEHEQHIKCIAAPIWNGRGQVVAAFSITAPVVRMHRARMRQLIPLVLKTSRAISEAIGYGIY
ncbi:MAG: IclR family transcriptional regulator [Acidobacteriaceae bacterium]|nr:IclR family transcriptional regulator [Acidobacteriaceae bacterium]